MSKICLSCSSGHLRRAHEVARPRNGRKLLQAAGGVRTQGRRVDRRQPDVEGADREHAGQFEHRFIS